MTATVEHTCPVCHIRFAAHPSVVYCGRNCSMRAYRQRHRSETRNSLAPLPEDLVERAFDLMRQGYATEVAAGVVGCTGRALRNHMRRRGLSLTTLRGPGVQVLTGRFPCRYCGQPARDPGGVCQAALCRQRAWDELPEAERTAQIALRRRGDHYAAHIEQGRRIDVHVLLSPADAQQLREQAAMRGQSLSSLVTEALSDAGLIGAGGKHALV